MNGDSFDNIAMLGLVGALILLVFGIIAPFVLPFIHRPRRRTQRIICTAADDIAAGALVRIDQKTGLVYQIRMGELDEIDPLTEEFRQLEQAVVQHAQRERKRGRGR